MDGQETLFTFGRDQQQFYLAGLEEIDRLVLIAAGPRSSTGYRVEVLRTTERRGDIRILAREVTPTLTEGVTPRLTSPFRLITIPATDKRVYVQWQGRP